MPVTPSSQRSATPLEIEERELDEVLREMFVPRPPAYEGTFAEAALHPIQTPLTCDGKKCGRCAACRFAAAASTRPAGSAPAARVRQRGQPNYALGRLKVGAMNQTEQAYADHLKRLQAVGEIQWHKFEGLKFRLADNTFYTPDFAVMSATGQIELHEVKGFWQDDARAKIKIASDMYPFLFIAVKKNPKKLGGGWAVEVF